MRRAPILVVAAIAVAGCGGDDDDDEAPERRPTATAPSAATASAPAYERVKRIALSDPEVRPICARSLEDRDIGSFPRGETYKRLLCGGREILDYVVGAEAVRENLAAARRLSPHPVWSGPGPAYATLAGPGPEDFAERVRAACGCGEVLRKSQ